jgi:hypothetical protein
MEYQNLAATAANGQERALVELVYGQLLTSVKRSGGQAALAQGFRMAVDWLGSHDYLHLMQRHELLCHLSVSSQGSPAAALSELLLEAQIIKRLQQSRRLPFRQPGKHCDTLD